MVPTSDSCDIAAVHHEKLSRSSLELEQSEAKHLLLRTTFQQAEACGEFMNLLLRSPDELINFKDLSKENS